MVFPVVFMHILLPEHTPRLGNALFMDLLAVATDQVVPGGQVLALADQAVTTGTGQPGELVGLARGELDAIRHLGEAVGVIAALAGLQVQQLARDARVIDAVVVFVLKLLQAAQAAAVAQRLPFLRAELLEGLAPPERRVFSDHHTVSCIHL